MDEATKNAYLQMISVALDEALKRSAGLHLEKGDTAEIEVDIPKDFLHRPPPPPPDNMEVDLLTKRIKITLKG